MRASESAAEPRWEDPYRMMGDLAWVLVAMAVVALATLAPFWPWN